MIGAISQPLSRLLRPLLFEVTSLLPQVSSPCIANCLMACKTLSHALTQLTRGRHYMSLDRVQCLGC